MYTKTSIRPYVIGSPVSRTMFAIIRVLIGSYFLAAGTGLILEPSSRTLFDAVLPGQSAVFATTAYLFITAFMVMTGKLVRPAALLLSIYIFWSAFIHFESAGAPGSLAQFWNDMALLGAVLLVAVTEPGGSESFHLWRKGRAVSPRRVTRDGDEPAHRANQRPELFGDPALRGTPDAAESIDDQDAETNLFGGVWDDGDLPAMPSFASQRATGS